ARYVLPSAWAGRAPVRRGRVTRPGRHDRLHHRGDEDDELDPRGRGRHDRRGPRGECLAGRVRRAALPGRTVTRTVEIVDTTTRDGNQSLWGATGLTAREILAIAPTLEQVGFHALDFTSSTHMSVSVRFHREDPWELIRLMRAAMPETLLNFITTG